MAALHNASMLLITVAQTQHCCLWPAAVKADAPKCNNSTRLQTSWSHCFEIEHCLAVISTRVPAGECEPASGTSTEATHTMHANHSRLC